MATEKVVYEAEFKTGEAGKSLADLKKEFKETSKQLSGLTQGTKEYYDALKKLGTIKDDMGDLRDSIESFSPDKKLKALGGVVTGLASGFTAVQGAMGLMGSESKELEQTLVKVQSAMAFSQGLQGLEGLSDAFKLLKANLMQFTIFQKIATAAQWLWNVAMNASPVMLIVTGITALVGAMALLVNAQDDEAEAIERTNELRKIALKDREKEIDLVKKKLNLINETNDFELEMAKAQGKSKEELYKLEKRNLEDRIKNLDRIKMLGRDLNATEINEKGDLYKKLALLDAKYSTESHNEFINKQNERIKKNKDEADKKHSDFLKSFDEMIKAENAIIKEEEAEEKKTKEEKAENKAKDDALDKQRAIDLAEWKKKYSKEAKEREKEENRKLLEESFALAQQANQAIGDLSNVLFDIKRSNAEKGSKTELALAKKQFRINQALALTNTAITTVQGMMKAVATNPPPSPIGVIGATLTGIAGIAAGTKIASQKFQGEGGGGGGGISLPSVSAPSVSAPRNDSTQLNADGTIVQQPKRDIQTVRAVVVETEMTSTQRRVNRIEQNAIL